ncbi:ABC transporter substrate-binding protein [Tomitella fengzijianii]|uniref:Iron-siderophore ABC transporter substrate-binding protein n=1 Tax=Tomitella fengzijianii TaxID=2597660 RepID=A0A516X6X7_9ACTN|nr:iron-siderophore ABC transporter substrate-binding protein [Tomitella fengzijianii]QDQ98411.1 iron-siderophore ABC transporter substrate-binding protein [Tomitella fengzijianii]
MPHSTIPGAHPAPRGRTGRGLRRRSGIAALFTALMALMLALTACGSGSGGSGEADAASPASSESVTVTDATGTEVEVPADPQRVVTLSELDLDSALALGVTPVGATAGRGQEGAPRYLGDKAADITMVGTVTGPELDKVIKADPDVILAGQVRDQQVLSRLRQIAPTVVTFQVGDNWKDAFANIAQALGRTDQQQAFMADYQAKIETVQQDLGPASDSVVSVVRWNPKGPSTINKGTFAGSVLNDLGVQRPEAQQETAQHSMPLSMENLDAIDGDWIFVGTLSGQGNDVDALDAAMASPSFAALNAVQEGHVSTVDGSMWMSLGGPLAATAMLDDVDTAMAN